MRWDLPARDGTAAEDDATVSEPNTTLRIAPLVSDFAKLRNRILSAVAMIALALGAEAWGAAVRRRIGR